MLMKIVNYGERYEIYPDDLKTFDELPAHTYKVGFHPMQGFYLTKTNDLESTETRVYGEHEAKVSKIMDTFEGVSRSLGAIFSGDKGIGKTMSVQLLSQKAIKKGLPVIIVEDNYKGISKYLDTIEQEAVVIFDEFEKKFQKTSRETDDTSQEDFLGLFDGMSSTKRLYIITVNEIGKLNNYLLNRPGRFHYHIRYEYPKRKEIIRYLEDKVGKDVDATELEAVADFGMRTSLNYDMLRAISFELVGGGKFKDFINDLNIIDLNSDRKSLDGILYFKDGKKQKLVLSGTLFGDKPELSIDSWNNEDGFEGKFTFDNSLIQRDDTGFTILPKHMLDFAMTRYMRDSDGDMEDVTVDLDTIEAVVIETKTNIKAYGYNL